MGQVVISRWPLAQWQPRGLRVDRNLLPSGASTAYSGRRGRGSVVDNLTTLVHAQQADLGSQQLGELPDTLADHVSNVRDGEGREHPVFRPRDAPGPWFDNHHG